MLCSRILVGKVTGRVAELARPGGWSDCCFVLRGARWLMLGKVWQGLRVSGVSRLHVQGHLPTHEP